MIKENKVTTEYVCSVQKRFVRTIFGSAAPHFGVWFDEKEIKYIETKMQTDKIFKLVGYTDITRSPYNRLFEFRRIWLNGFLQDPYLPIGIRAFIKHYIAYEFGKRQMDDEHEGTNKYKDSIDYEPMAQRWMEKCR